MRSIETPFLHKTTVKKKTVKTYLSAGSFAFHISRFQLFTAFKTYENEQDIYYHASSIGEFFLREVFKQTSPKVLFAFPRLNMIRKSLNSRYII